VRKYSRHSANSNFLSEIIEHESTYEFTAQMLSLSYLKELLNMCRVPRPLKSP